MEKNREAVNIKTNLENISHKYFEDGSRMILSQDLVLFIRNQIRLLGPLGEELTSIFDDCRDLFYKKEGIDKDEAKGKKKYQRLFSVYLREGENYKPIDDFMNKKCDIVLGTIDVEEIEEAVCPPDMESFLRNAFVKNDNKGEEIKTPKV